MTPLPQENLLPDFCQVRILFSVVLLGEVLACVLVLSPLGHQRWDDLALVSLFIQWVVLSSAGLLCLLRPWLARLNPYSAAAASYALVVALVAGFSHLAWILVIAPDGGPPFSNFAYHAFLARAVSVGALVSAVGLRYFYVQYHWRRNALAAGEARLQALQARIRPHFLFNALNTIASLTRLDPARAEQAVEDLAELFRASVADAGRQIPLAEELALCRHYLRIENLRLGERCQVEWQIDTLPLDALIPPLSLQPLLENAICYGIQPLPEGGVIRVTGLCDGRNIRIEVENPQPPDVSPHKHQGLHIAQDNLRQRLQTFYGRQGSLEVQRTGKVYLASLRFPYHAPRPPLPAIRA